MFATMDFITSFHERAMTSAIDAVIASIVCFSIAFGSGSFFI